MPGRSCCDCVCGELRYGFGLDTCASFYFTDIALQNFEPGLVTFLSRGDCDRPRRSRTRYRPRTH